MTAIGDPIDIASDRAELEREMAMRNTAKDIPPGVPGECEYCGDESPRLIKNACARCRDEFRLG